LRNLPRIKDLVCDMTPFFERWQRAGGRFKGAAGRGDPIPRLDPSSAQRRAADAGIECINCAVCYSACDTVAWNPDYLGPAALNRAWTLVNDARHVEQGRILDAMGKAGGCHDCHTHGSCVEYCPVELNPTASIAGLKRRSVRRLFATGDA
jgi:fumarate reductase iron-sulfur subunit